MKAVIAALLLGFAPSVYAENALDPFEAVRSAVAKIDFKTVPSGKEKAAWETRLTDVEARTEDISDRLDSGFLTKARTIELEADLWEAFRVGARIKRLLRGPLKPIQRNLGALPGLPAVRPLPITRPLTVK